MYPRRGAVSTVVDSQSNTHAETRLRMNPLTIHSQPEGLRRPVLITAFNGWNDAAESATTAARYLGTAFGAEKFAEIDPEEFYHFGLSRPYVRYKSGSETDREIRSEEHTSELQSRLHLVCRLLLEKKKQ